MKNSTRLLYLGVLVLLLLPLTLNAQEVVQSQGFFSKIGSWVKGNFIEFAVAFIGGMMAKHGWTLIIKKIASKGKVIAKELGELFSDGAILLDKVDCAIRDDGTVVQNSIADVISAGKEVIAEGKDVIISIRPK